MDKASLQRIHLAIENSRDTIISFPWDQMENYKFWLSQSFQIVSHTTRFLTKLGGSFGHDRNDFHLFSLRHLSEETNHELMAEKDLETLNSHVNRYPILSSTREMINSQYALLSETPVAHFGFFLYLEILSVEYGPIVGPILDAHFGAATRFVRHHVNEDPRHVDLIIDQLGKAKQDEISQAIVNMESTQALYCEMMKDIMVRVADLKIAS